MSKAFDSINPRTYTQIHTPTVVQAGWMEPLPEVLIWCSSLNDFTFSGKPLINKMRYILWVVVLLEACDVTNNGHHLGRHLGSYQELEIRLKQREMIFFLCLT